MTAAGHLKVNSRGGFVFYLCSLLQCTAERRAACFPPIPWIRKSLYNCSIYKRATHIEQHSRKNIKPPPQIDRQSLARDNSAWNLRWNPGHDNCQGAMPAHRQFSLGSKNETTNLSKTPIMIDGIKNRTENMTNHKAIMIMNSPYSRDVGDVGGFAKPTGWFK